MLSYSKADLTGRLLELLPYIKLIKKYDKSRIFFLPGKHTHTKKESDLSERAI